LNFFRQFFKSRTSSNPSSEGGFTLVELLVVIAIMVLVASLVLVQRRSASEALEVTNLAYEVALFIRQAQSYGIAVREEDIGSGEFNIGYGVLFDETNPTQISLFRDIDRNSLYNSGDSILEVMTLNDGYTVALFCGETSGGGLNCSSGGGLDTLAISFVRPSPDAQIEGDPPSSPYSAAHVHILSPSGFEKVISTYITGQIAIENS
jgi:prepilin-type N-terminal cleavage/methylation domain-containing protein